VGGTGNGKFARGKVEMLHAAAFDKRQGLERLGAGAQKGDRLRVAVGCDQFAVRVYNDNAAIVN